MTIQNKLCFVQFMHPGKEHRPDSGGFKDWNDGPHKRKFVENKGRCLRQGKKFEGSLRFWTEWEPQSEAIATITDPIPNGPKFVYKPFYIIPRSYHGLQNTDPFVFENFFYTGCQQHTVKGPTQLRYLERGSVILFGSNISGKFAIDTVFVVDEFRDYNAADFKKLLGDSVPRTYSEVTLAALHQAKSSTSRGGSCRRDSTLRLYWGATVNNPVNGMFSYFPCVPAKKCSRGFARAVFENEIVITDSLLQGKRLNRGLVKRDVRKHWQEVRDQVEAAGLWLGVHAELPMRRLKSA